MNRNCLLWQVHGHMVVVTRVSSLGSYMVLFCRTPLLAQHFVEQSWWLHAAFRSAGGCTRVSSCSAAACRWSRRACRLQGGVHGSHRGNGLFVEQSVHMVAFIPWILGHLCFWFLKYAFSFLYSSSAVLGVFVCFCCFCKRISARCSFIQKGMLELMKLCNEQK